MPDWDAMALVGRIARPHGLRGQVIVTPETDFVDERFKVGAVLWTRSESGSEETLTIVTSRIQNGRPVVGFEGFSRVEDVEGLAGLELRIPEAALHPLGPGVYYEHQLVGCSVSTTSGAVVGVVRRVEGGSGSSRLVVDGAHGEIQVPLAADICQDIDIDARQIRIDPPDGLLELNDTKRSRRRGSATPMSRT